MKVAAMLPIPTRRHGATARRGMLLLLVLSILALFLVIGALAVLLALRARESARAFAAATASAAGSASLARAQLDEALLKLIRGGTQAGGVTESLLQDKYGGSESCTVTASSTTAFPALIQVTVTGLNLSNPAAIAGRVLTFVPAVGDPTGPTSYRILRPGSTPNTLLLANVRPTVPLPLPTRFPCEAVINGREFVAEPYDAFDDQNPFLTGPTLQSGSISVQRAAFGAVGVPCTVDNDNDGVADGIWLSNVLPPQRTADGGQLTFDVSYLVLDLDGRINLNAHGSFVRAQAPQSTSEYPRDPATVPVGMGYGPADVDAARFVATPQESGTVPVRWVQLLQGGTMTTNALASSATQWRPTPRAETTQAGRYGFGPGAAQPGGSTITGTMPLHSDFWLAGDLAGNSPTDLKARLQVYTEGSPPTLRFARPSPAWGNPDTDDVLGGGVAAHPYRMRLDGDAPRAVGITGSDAVFTPAELERILRQFDGDAALLAPRLAALLDDTAERLRMTVTTDSWDTPAIVGNAAQTIAALSGTAVYGFHSPEVIAGLRFNVNRPIVDATGRQEYFKHFYSLLRALQVPAADAAQWAANVVEFRDADSIMMWYPYVDDPASEAWPPPTSYTKGVWGAERPEMVIKSVTVDGNKATVSLYRPWKAELFVGKASLASGTTERIDAALGNQGANTLDATLKSGESPVWRLSVGGTTGTGLDTELSSATAVGPNADVGQASVSGNSPPTRVMLQRLAAPNAAFDEKTNPYVTVDSVSIGADPPRTEIKRCLHWPNRDLVSHGELLAVQSGSAGDLAKVMFEANVGNDASLPSRYPLVLDATIVPSRFVGAHVSVASGSTALAAVGMQNFQHSQFSRWREAGRVNVNTILEPDVWKAVLGRDSPDNPATPQQPVRTDQNLLPLASLDRSGADAASEFLRRSSAIRLANVATTRSHVFAVWITLRIKESSPNAGPDRFHRLFAIVDRSIPVGFGTGRTLNVRDAIRLERFLE